MVNEPETAAAKQDLILRHIATFQVTLRPVLDRLFFDGKPNGCKNAVATLITKGLIESASRDDRVALHGGFSYYYLTQAGVLRAEWEQSKSRLNIPGKGGVLESCLPLLWHCAMGEYRRYRAEPQDVARFLDIEPPHNALHCLDPRLERIYRTYVPQEKRSTSDIITKCHVELGKIHAAAPVWHRAKSYGFLVFIDVKERAQRLRRAVEDDPYLDADSVFVALAPSPTRLKEFVR